MLMVYTLGGGIFQLVFTLTITSWIGSAYFIRVQVLIIRDREYNLASRCLGTSRWKVITHNIFPYPNIGDYDYYFFINSKIYFLRSCFILLNTVFLRNMLH